MKHQESIFKSIFGTAWNKRPAVFKKRYMNRSFSEDIQTVEGHMDIAFSKGMALLTPVFRLLHILVPYSGKNIPVQVVFRSCPDSDHLYFDRKFYFQTEKPYEFNSCMIPTEDGDVIERMAFGLCWRSHCFYEDQKVVMAHKGYAWRIGRFNIPMPLEIFIGKGCAEETVIDDDSYRITMSLSHPWFGVLYHYSGNFSFKKVLV